MTGMKEGAGEDPFADDADASETDSDDESKAGPVADDSATAGESPTAGSKTAADEEIGGSGGGATGDEPGSPDSGVGRRDRNESRRKPMQIPYKFRRDGVQDGRNRVPLFLKPDTKRAERDAMRELETRFGDDVSLTDLREALVLVGLEHLDEVEERFSEWGYGMTFDE